MSAGASIYLPRALHSGEKSGARRQESGVRSQKGRLASSVWRMGLGRLGLVWSSNARADVADRGLGNKGYTLDGGGGAATRVATKERKDRKEKQPHPLVSEYGRCRQWNAERWQIRG